MSSTTTSAGTKTIAERLEAKRQSMVTEFFDRQFILGGFLGGTDTYKRTMWQAVPDIAQLDASYHLTFRRPLAEPGAGNQLIMAGHEAMLAQWFRRPLKREDIELASEWFKNGSHVKAFPQQLWDSILAKQPGEDIYLPIDVWGFPGGQTFLTGVPALSFEGVGGAISYLEPAMLRYYAPIIQATKAMLMKLVVETDAEFGLRSAPSECANLILLLARYVGSGGTGQLSSNDNAEFMFPGLFKAAGTVGHEMMCSNQSPDRPLGEAEYEMMERYVAAMGNGLLLGDLVDATTIGLENVIRVLTKYKDKTRFGARIDSGEIAAQCVQYHQAFKAAGMPTRTICFEDEVSPTTAAAVLEHFRKETGSEPVVLLPGAGGYWWKLVHRDSVSGGFKRSQTNGVPQLKFSNSPGKESIPGRVRVYAQDDMLVVGDASETIEGEALYVQLVKDGRIVYGESYADQAARSPRTWGKYKGWQTSPKVTGWLEKYRSMRAAEIAAAKERAQKTTSAPAEKIES